MVDTSRAHDVNPGEAILDAGLRLAVERGSAFTTQDVIEEAGVALQTFYRYYAGKDQLLLAMIEDQIGTNAADLRVSVSDVVDPVEHLEHFVRVTVAAHDDPRAAGGIGKFVTAEHWRLHEAFPTEVAAATEPITALIRETVEDGRASAPSPPISRTAMLGSSPGSS